MVDLYVKNHLDHRDLRLFNCRPQPGLGSGTIPSAVKDILYTVQYCRLYCSLFVNNHQKRQHQLINRMAFLTFLLASAWPGVRANSLSCSGYTYIYLYFTAALCKQYYQKRQQQLINHMAFFNIFVGLGWGSLFFYISPRCFTVLYSEPCPHPGSNQIRSVIWLPCRLFF